MGLRATDFAQGPRDILFTALPFHTKTEAENKWQKVALAFWFDCGCPCVMLGGSS